MKTVLPLAAVAALWLSSSGLKAATLAHEFFPGHGNPQDFIVVDSGGIELGLQAQPRFSGPAVTHFGDTYFVEPGPGTSPGLSTWNFDWVIDTNPTNALTPPSLLADYTALITITGPGGSTFTYNPLFPINDNNPAGSLTLAQNSENLGFAVLFNPPVGSTTGPAFNPNATGLYTFTLSVTPNITSFAAPLGVIADPSIVDIMKVQVGLGPALTPVPLPAAAPMGIATLSTLALGALLRKKRRSA